MNDNRGADRSVSTVAHTLRTSMGVPRRVRLRSPLAVG
jgi:hypothetical protein